MSASRRSASWPQLVAISLIGLELRAVARIPAASTKALAPIIRSRPRTATLPVPSKPRPQTISTASRCRISAAPIKARPAAAAAWVPLRFLPGFQWRSDRLGARSRPRHRLGPGKAARRSRSSPARPSTSLRTGTACRSRRSCRPTTSRARRWCVPGQHLVIPRYRQTPGANSNLAAEPRYTSSVASVAAPVGPPRSALAAPSGVHVVAPGETLNSIARIYNKPVMVLAKVNNIPPTTMVRVGDRITIPEMRGQQRPTVASAATRCRQRLCRRRRARSR